MKNIKQNKGITGIDIAISLGVIAITSAILGALYFNLYISKVQIERKAEAINFASQILEKIKNTNYVDVTEENFRTIEKPNGKNEVAGLEIPKGYNVTIQVNKYKQNEVEDVVKQIVVTIKYKIGEKDNIVKLTKNKLKEVYIIPNAPILETNMIAIKSVKNGNSRVYRQTSEMDNEWYNYNNKNWALSIKNTTGDVVKTQDLYVWIPRYAYNRNDNTDVVFLHLNTNKTVNSGGNLEDVSNNYIVDSKFSNTNGYWIKVSELQNDNTAKRLNNSNYGQLVY